MVLDSVRIDLAELMRRKLCVHSQNIVNPLSGRQSPRREPPPGKPNALVPRRWSPRGLILESAPDTNPGRNGGKNGRQSPSIPE